MTDADVRELFEALRRGMAGADLVETHISWVLLVGETALKIKKPVDLGFVDFTTLERRRHFCEVELRLNRRTAPELYLDVVPITGSPSDPVLGDDGRPPFEYAVRMRRFEQEDLLAAVLARGELTARQVEPFAAGMADFHERCARADDSTEFGTPEAIRNPAEQNFVTLTECLGDPEHRSRLDALRSWTTREFEARQDDFDARRREGFVRECHGDAHLGNAILDRHDGRDRVILFDGVEFSPDLRWIDVVSDAAFTVMDLADRGRPDLSHRFLNAYVEHTSDHGGLTVLGFYLVYRSLVRAKVAAIRRDQPGVSNDERTRLTDELEGYLRLAEQYHEVAEPRLVITSGVSGSGKSTVALHVVDELGAIRLRSDVERKRLAGSDVFDLYSRERTERTYQRLRDLASNVIRSGRSAIVDATFLDRDRRGTFQELARELGVPFVIAHVVADPTVLRDRVARRALEGTDVSDADVTVLERQLESQESPTNDEANFVVNVESADPRSLERLTATIRSTGAVRG